MELIGGGCMDNKYLLCLISLIIGLIFGNLSHNDYVIIPSNKIKCDILLNKSTGETWFNQNGYWEKVSKDFLKQ